jgi:hypothetical protein
MVRMAMEAIHANGGKGLGGRWEAAAGSQFTPNLKSHDHLESATISTLQSSESILSALGDESSRRILTSAISGGKTVEEISAEQNLPLSTCYRRIRHFVDDGLMILERLVVTPAGKRFAIYRTSFSDVTIRFYPGETAVETTPNVEVLDKLRTRWLSTNYPSQSQGSGPREKAGACHARQG